MDEPLFDGVSAAIVLIGSGAVITLRLAVTDVANAARTRQFWIVGNVLLGIAVSLFLYRWIDSATSLSSPSRSDLWRSGLLVTTSAIGLVASVKSVLEQIAIRRIRFFVIAVVYGVISALIPATWDWFFQMLSSPSWPPIIATSFLMILFLSVLAPGILNAVWFPFQETLVAKSVDDHERLREPTLVLSISAAMLLLLLGTWQHAIANETQRETRSSRFSAWPRATALRNAWERTGWAVKPTDKSSEQRVAEIALSEQRIAWGLGSLLLILAIASALQAPSEPGAEETNHAG